MRYYYLGLGSNLNPAKNVEKMLLALQELSPEVVTSRIIQTTPAGFSSDKPFFNLAARIQSSLSPEALKEQFNQIETQLGRDRTDPDRKLKDRVADIDILFHTPMAVTEIDARDLPAEPYLRAPMVELLDFLGIIHRVISPVMPEGISLTFHGKTIGKKPGQLPHLILAA